MTYTADPRVDAYIDALPAWQQVICREVRDLIHAADAEVVETIKFTNRPYFVPPQQRGDDHRGRGRPTLRTLDGLRQLEPGDVVSRRSACPGDARP